MYRIYIYTIYILCMYVCLYVRIKHANTQIRQREATVGYGAGRPAPGLHVHGRAASGGVAGAPRGGVARARGDRLPAALESPV